MESSSASAGRVASAVLDPRRWWALALVLLVYAVVEAPGADWGDVRTILPLAGSAVLVAAFALTEGYQSAFLACAVLAGIGLALAFLPPRPTAEASARAARTGPGGRCRCRRRRGDQVRNEMSEQRTGSYHPRRLRRR
jgi:hypothetical protein